jgi:hypothetical protein
MKVTYCDWAEAWAHLLVHDAMKSNRREFLATLVAAVIGRKAVARPTRAGYLSIKLVISNRQAFEASLSQQTNLDPMVLLAGLHARGIQ